MNRALRAALLLSACALAAAAGSPAPAGRVCIGGECRAAGRTFSVTAQEAERRYVWSGDGGAVLAFGTIPRGATTVDIDVQSPRKALVSIEPVDDGAITLQAAGGDGEPAWSWTLADPAALRAVQLPAGVKTLVVTAPRHRPAQLAVPAAPRDRVALGRVTLSRYDLLAGRVVLAEGGAPVIGAAIETTGGRAIAESGPDGTFEIDIDAALAANWPTALHVRAPGYGTKTLPLAAAPQPRRWDRIALSAGGSLNVRVADTRPSPDDVVLELRRHRGDRPDAWETIARGATKAGGGESVTFHDLDAGKYLLLATGSKPLEQIATDVEIAAATTTDVAIDIVPVPLRIVVRQGSESVPEAKIELDHRNRWTARLAAANGVHESALWQRGDLAAFVTVPGSGVFRTRTSIGPATDAVEWLVQIPDRAIHGRVTDRGTRKPLGDVVVALETATSKQVTRTASDGAYRFDFLTPAQYTVRVLATSSFLPAALEIPLGENDRIRTANFELATAALTRLRFVTPSGQPAANAKVYDPAQPDVESATDDAGEVTIRLAGDETRRIIAVPWSGALSVVDVAPPHDQRQPRVVPLQEGPATLTVVAKDDEGRPIPGIWYRLRHNGVPLPDDVLIWVAARDGSQLATGPDGVSVLAGMPLGVYELWPVTTPRQSRGGAAGERAPVRFVAQPGDNPVRLTFTRW